MKILKFVVSMLLWSPLFCFGQNNYTALHSTIAAQQYKSQIRVIDTSKELTEAFGFIADEIGDKRVVALGEQTHTPDGSFAVRAKLIEYLIEHHGFEVILFEAGMFDLHIANERLQKKYSIRALQDGLYAFWGNPSEHAALFEFLQSRLANEEEITFAGFDCKLTSKYGRTQESYLKAITHQLQLINVDTSAVAYKQYIMIWQKIEEDMKKGGLKSISYKMKKVEKDRFLHFSRVFQEKLLENNNRYWAQMIRTVDESVVLYSDFSLLKALFNKNALLSLNNKRDSLMAENLNYLLHEKYKDKKVLLIGATYHFARNVSRIQPTKVKGLDLSKSVTMGEIIQAAEKENIFVIGFTAPETMFCEAKKRGIDKPFSCLQNELAYDVAYFPLHRWNLQQPNLNLQQTIKILDPKSETRHPNWNEVLDAVVLINK